MRERLQRIARRLDRGLLPFLGPAQLGAGHPEGPVVRTGSAACPICGAPMSRHEIIRSADPGRATRLICPA